MKLHGSLSVNRSYFAIIAKQKNTSQAKLRRRKRQRVK